MTTSPAKGTWKLLDAEYWTARKWFTFLIVLLLCWTGIYLLAHSQYGFSGSEYAKFTPAQVRQINKILNPHVPFASRITVPVRNSALPDSAAGNETSNSTEVNTDVDNSCDINCRTDKALLYISKEYDNRVSSGELEEIKKYISTFGPQDVGLFLVDYKIKVGSYFWLTGPLVYLEIVFWVTIGVLCSILFSIGSVLRRPGPDSFHSKEIIYQVAKMFYAPFSAIVIVLAYSYFKDDTTLNIDATEGVIVFAFIVGFYSGRVMNFLDRLKQVLLPSANLRPDAFNPYYAGQPQAAAPQAAVVNVENTGAQPSPETVVAVPAKPVDDKDIKEVDIDLKLDLSGMGEDEKDALEKLGFNKAIVTLHNVNGRDIIPARRADDKSSTTFIATDVKPGIYIARATLSQKLKDDHIVNLFGERTAYVTVDKPGLELYVRKYESVD